MGENTNISWTDHTLRAMGRPVTRLAKGEPVVHVEPKFRKVCERFHMVGVRLPGAATFSARIPVAGQNRTSPMFVFTTVAKSDALDVLSILKTVASRSAGSAKASNGADPIPYFLTVFRAYPVTRVIACGLTHLATRLVTHTLAFHRRDEGSPTLYPCLADYLGACHG